MKTILFALAGFLLIVPAHAQAPGASGGPPKRWTLSLEAGIAASEDADLDGGAAFSSTDFYAVFGGDLMVNRNFIVGLSFGAGEKRYDFSGATELTGADP